MTLLYKESDNFGIFYSLNFYFETSVVQLLIVMQVLSKYATERLKFGVISCQMLQSTKSHKKLVSLLRAPASVFEIMIFEHFNM